MTLGKAARRYSLGESEEEPPTVSGVEKGIADVAFERLGMAGEEMMRTHGWRIYFSWPHE